MSTPTPPATIVAEAPTGLQSPFNIETAKIKPGPEQEVMIDFSPVPLAVENTGHTVRYDNLSGGVTVNGTRYEAEQLHVHFPSEHTVDGQPHAGVIHMVCKNPENPDDVTVLSVFVNTGAKENHPGFEALAGHVPAPHETDACDKVRLDPRALLPIPQQEGQPATLDNIVMTQGSFTTPPYSPAQWLIVREPIQISAAQMEAFVGRDAHDAEMERYNIRQLQDEQGREMLNVSAQVAPPIPVLLPEDATATVASPDEPVEELNTATAPVEPEQEVTEASQPHPIPPAPSKGKLIFFGATMALGAILSFSPFHRLLPLRVSGGATMLLSAVGGLKGLSEIKQLNDWINNGANPEERPDTPVYDALEKLTHQLPFAGKKSESLADVAGASVDTGHSPA